MPRAGWNAKRERQYQHIKQSEVDRGVGMATAEEIAARTVNKERARSGEAKTASRSSTSEQPEIENARGHRRSKGADPGTPPAAARRGSRQEMPSEVNRPISIFDRFAGHASAVVSRAPFFTFCVVLVLVWLPSYMVFRNIDTWQLVINTITTIVTFLLVALLQNTQERTDAAGQQKLNAIAQGLAGLMEHAAGDQDDRLRSDICELKKAVGLEQREGS
jgi:hypothetical protein